jgi:ESF2/ABP1 family protein
MKPEDSMISKKRKKFGGNKKQKYTEGWVEFEDKKLARRVAESLNGTNIERKKGSHFHDDLWTMKYLPKFKCA